MVLANTLDLTITDGRIVYDGVAIHSILVEHGPAKQTVAISPKHKQSFLSGNLMISDTKGIVYVPLDEVNKAGKCIVLGPNGSLSPMPSMSYEAYLKDKQEFEEKRRLEALAEKPTFEK